MNITIQDISTIIKIIDVCTKRGAFEGSELLIVGQLREKLDSIVKTNASKTEQKFDAD